MKKNSISNEQKNKQTKKTNNIMIANTTLSDLFFNSSEAAKWNGETGYEGGNIQECAKEFLENYPSFKDENSSSELAQDFLNRV